MSSVVRLISASKSDFEKMSPMDLKASIYASEGRVVMSQHMAFMRGDIFGVTNTEMVFACGSDMSMINCYDFDDDSKNVFLQGHTFQEIKARVNRPLGFYMGCPKKDFEITDDAKIYNLGGTVASVEHFRKAKELGGDFIILGGNPGTGTSLEDIIYWTKVLKDMYGEDIFVFAGKWEDGVNEKVLGDPLARYDAKEVIRRLIDAGADCIDLPAPGSRHGITVDMIRELVEYVHTYKEGTLAMCFLDGSVEGADPDTIRQITILMKQTGCDIHAIGDGGVGGLSDPDNVYQMSMTLRGKLKTWFRIASTNR